MKRYLFFIAVLGCGLIRDALAQAASVRFPNVANEASSLRQSNNGELTSSEMFLVGGLPAITVRVNGRINATFLIDTGFLKTSVSKRLADQLHLAIDHRIVGKVIGSGDRIAQDLDVIKNVRISISDAFDIKGSMECVDLTEISTKLGNNVDGIIGFDFLASRPIVLDFRGGKFIIFDPLKSSSKDCFEKLALKIPAPDRPIVSANLDLSDRSFPGVPIFIDTGFQRALMITTAFSAVNDLGSLSGWKHETGLGLGGSFAYLYGLSGELSLGRMRIEIPNVSVSQARSGLLADGTYSAVLGSDILSQFTVVLDVAHGYVCLNR